ncbi:Nucleolar protein 13 [Ophidiomyces ophidiicola]|uniref:Nucleolar protein 13 n=1 Tax=Ophidiomyces ophidiicola TaxID=1387563 RepID=UPI0020C22CA9|nr:Nucleolar protein 13 [Ophidiomyces ophidiicola]KAI1943363.1 Nucleolar protein 13 [Ophidiomyces ophidiicola]KAI1953007.1 Nucleolar protein 13 [Ophidiomyces ophidiicola]KAI1962646.1 Nucleolar protein 13 [Ophidiomyces ophidiicola]KAI1973525.1 Nucleolar protein 13 [Ophidiomyces ophidiicola]KAI2025841.1 Nucleolar protein 13 [Ophidiomyces ophidiicola]
MAGDSNSPLKANGKRKLDPDIEVDINAPEPPSKKALRKAKKKSVSAKIDITQSTGLQPKAQDVPKELTKKRSGFGIWIGNLPFSASQDNLLQFFTTLGSFNANEIIRIHLPNGEKRNGKQQNKGFAYIDFSTSAAVPRAIALSEKLLLGRAVLIKDANNFSGRPEKSGDNKDDSARRPGNPASNKIFVGNLGFDVTKQILEEHYKSCGGISHVHLATFEDSGKCKGYGWVEFDDLDAAEAAVRGFVRVPDGEHIEVNEESLAHVEAEHGEKTKRKLKEKKMWVNRLMGRSLRVDFAEDSSTRYKKRFGKEGFDRRPQPPTNGGGVQDGSLPPTDEVPRENHYESWRGERRTQLRPKGKKVGSGGRYSEETVQRLSGAIVEAEGKKIKFD